MCIRDSFFNGGVEKPNEGEDRVLIPSSKVATFDMKPEMSAYEITDKAIELINEKKYDVMILNFANCDMVGHTGVMEAAMKAVAAVDECVDRVVKAVLDNGGRAFAVSYTHLDVYKRQDLTNPRSLKLRRRSARLKPRPCRMRTAAPSLRRDIPPPSRRWRLFSTAKASWTATR